jgi:hypothetical protein
MNSKTDVNIIKDKLQSANLFLEFGGKNIINIDNNIETVIGIFM